MFGRTPRSLAVVSSSPHAEPRKPALLATPATTTYVDEAGNPVKVETVKSGAPVTVFYSKSGDKMVATKVVVRKTTVTEPAR